MRILAFHPGCHDAAAAAFDDYQLVAAVSEERLTRRKGSGDGIPWQAIDEVLRTAGWSRNDVDVIASTRSFFPWHFLRYPLHKEVDYAFRRWLGRKPSLRDLMVHSQRRGTAETLTLFRTDQFLAEQGFRADTRFFFANHHQAHGLASLFYTDWKEALIYTADGVGDNVSYSIRSLKDGHIQCHYGDDRWLLQRGPLRNSLAWAYGYATQACGFTMLRHEGKLTGLAAFGAPELAEELGQHFCVDENGLIAAKFADEPALAAKILGICRGHPREIIAASIQKVVEERVLQAVCYWLRRVDSRHLALGGGLFANVRLNRSLAEQAPLDELFIFPAMGDEGLAVGAALCFLLERDGLQAWLGYRRRLSTVYLGFDYDGAVDRQLAVPGRVRQLSGRPGELASELLLAGRAGALYAGRMEFGPRALGARSILASPADAAINDSLNRRLQRSEFMPFAPYVLEEDAQTVFEITDINRYAARFMTITCSVRPNWRSKIPAVVHVDGTARPQIICAADNDIYAEILRRFKAKSGLPVLVNTSFNVHEEPIVNRPDECVRALLEGRVDFVATREAVYVAV